MLDVLVADDDENVRESIDLALRSRGHQVTLASDGAKAAQLVSSHVFDLAICDVRMPGIDGLALLRRIRRDAPSTAVVIMTTFAQVRDVVGSLRDGAIDYVTKPFDPDEFTERVVDPIAERRSIAKRFETARADFVARSTGVTLVAKSPRMSKLAARVAMLASSDAPVLISGEKGAGKELIARTLHAQGPRREGPLVFVQGAQLLDVMEAASTGELSRTHGRGDEWFRAAAEGTLVIDEVDRLPSRAQAHLLRVVDEPAMRARRGHAWHPLGVRVLSLTRENLDASVASGKFLDALYYRLNGTHLEVPPLRERREDLCSLVTELLRELVPASTTVPGITLEAWRAIERHDFPDNVRELRWALEQAVAVSGGTEISVRHLPSQLLGSPE